MSIQKNGYYITSAVLARYLLLLKDDVSDAERKALVWDVVKEFLEIFEKIKPKEILCFLGSAWRLPHNPGLCRNIYMVNNQRQIAYIGTAFSQSAMKAYRRREVRWQKKMLPYEAEVLREKKLSTVIYNYEFCAIPIESEELTHTTIGVKLQKHFSNRKLPHLAKAHVAWLPDEEGDSLDRQIWNQALSIEN